MYYRCCVYLSCCFIATLHFTTRGDKERKNCSIRKEKQLWKIKLNKETSVCRRFKLKNKGYLCVKKVGIFFFFQTLVILLEDSKFTIKQEMIYNNQEQTTVINSQISTNRHLHRSMRRNFSLVYVTLGISA